MVDAAEQSQGGGSILPLLLLVGVFALMYFLVIRPQSQRRKQMTQMQGAVEEGAPVMTLGGLYGTVVSAEGDSVVLEVSPGVTNRYARAAIAKVLSDEEAMKAGLVPTEDVDNVDDVEDDDVLVAEAPVGTESGNEGATPVAPAVETPATPGTASDVPVDPTADPLPASEADTAKGGSDRR